MTLCFLLLFLLNNSFAQQADSLQLVNDTTALQNVTVTAFASQLRWKDVPASVAVLNKQNLLRYDGVSLVPSINTIPGVRMEERSPGSYRLSVRGSLLRSPFGVRNVKVYWDDVPLTDATGNTYINLVDVNSLQAIEIIKGPAASFYGANTGGAVILHSEDSKPYKKNVFNTAVGGGSFGMLNEETGWRYGNEKFVSNLQQSHLQNDGYRQQSALRKDVVKWNSRWNMSSKESLSFLAFYTNLHYETPGGITQAQLDENPKLSRQAAGSFPGAIDQKAGIYNETALGAVTLRSAFTNAFGNTTSLVINKTSFQNPFITNYEDRKEWNYSGRTDFHYSYRQNGFALQANLGTEFQYNDSYIKVFGNKGGVPDTTQYKDKVHVTQYFIFAQLNMNIGSKLFVQAGASRNEIRYWYNRTTDASQVYPKITNSDPVISPRFGVSYAAVKALSFYGTMAKGFSPPTLAEVRPSTGIVNYTLQPEYGWNYEAGIKGSVVKNMLEYNASFYYFNLKNAIVRRIDAAGADYYVNAGSTIQKGVEVWLNGHIIHDGKGMIASLGLWNSFTYQPYRFNDYVIGTTVYSGNVLTGVPRKINITGLDIKTKHHYYANVTFNYTSVIYLNDANTVTAKPYHLLQAKLGREFIFSKCNVNVFFGVDNLLDEVYSLGNDINAAGSRYFNAAPGRNYYGGIRLQL
ncbi:MAG: TonB-dependent receptor [Panacibacter sp.]